MRSSSLSVLLLCSSTLCSASFNVTNANDSGAGSLRQAIYDSNAAGGSNVITIFNPALGTITLLSSLPPIRNQTSLSFIVLGTPTIDGQNQFRVFSVDSGSVAFENFNIINGTAQGGDGGNGGGGGAGLGGGLFVNTGSVTLSDVSFSGCRALGGNGGAGSDTFSGGGGGGMGGDGGSGTSGAGGGGGGFQCPATGNGGGIADAVAGCTASDPQGGAVGSTGSAGANNPCSNGGGGGAGGAGVSFGGGGGGGGSGGRGGNTSSATGCNGGNGNVGGIGNFGGGGGGGGNAGGAGSGALESGSPGSPGNGAAGGFGGGGGCGGNAASLGAGGSGAIGGFGGGGGGGGLSNGAGQPGGAFAGNGGNGQSGAIGQTQGGGGGGAALGGAVFVNTGGSLAIVTSASSPFSGGTTPVPGTGGSPGGTAGNLGTGTGGKDIFLNDGATLVFQIPSDTVTLANPIEGTTTGSGGGLIKDGLGTLVLNGTNTYSGSTNILGGGILLFNTGATLQSADDINVTSGSLALNDATLTQNVQVSSGSTIRGSGSLAAVTVNDTSTIVPTPAGEAINITSLMRSGVLNLNTAITSTDASELNVTGPLSLSDIQVSVTQTGSGYSSSRSYPILTAGSLTGSITLPTVTGGYSGFNFNLQQSGNTLLLQYTTLPQNATWTNGAADGAWTTAANWSTDPLYPDGADSSATFAGAGSPQMITLGQTITLGTLDVTSGAYQIGTNVMTDSLTLSVSSGSAALNISSGAGAQTLTLGSFTLDSPLLFTNMSANPVTFNGTELTAAENLTIDQGEFIYDGTNPAASTAGLILNSGGTLTAQQDMSFVDLSGAGQLQIVGSTFSLVNPSAVSFSGAISVHPTAGGNFLKEGSGTLTLSGANSFSGMGAGRLEISEGTLSVSSSSNFGNPDLFYIGGSGPAVLQITGSSPFTHTNPVFLVADGTFDIGSSTSLSLNGMISESPGPAGLIKEGGGLLNLGGANTYPGNTTINSGRVNINGTSNSPVIVNSGATLGGTGTIQETVTLVGASTLSPGTSIGTLNIDSLSLSSNSITLIEINPITSSQIIVTGNASLNGNVQVLVDAGSYPSSGSYPILTAGSITGSYNPTVLGGQAGFTFQLMQNASTVTLLYGFISPTPSSLIPTTDLTGNTKKFADYLNEHAPSSPALTALAALSGAALKNGLNSASPARNAFATFVTQNLMFGVSQLVSAHLVDQRYFRTTRDRQPTVAALFAENGERGFLTADSTDCCNPWTPPNPCNNCSFWVNGFGQYSHLKSQDQNPSFNAYSGAAMLGFDLYSRQNLFGVGGGYAYTHLVEDNDAGHGKINYYFINLYDTLFFSKGYVEFGAWGTYNQIHNYRHISFPGFDATASATIKSWQLVPHIGFGFHQQFCWGDIEPFAQADCAINWQQSFDEKGAGSFNMSQEAQTSELLRAEGGIRFYESRETSWGAWMILEKLSYVYQKTFNTGRVSAAIVGTPALFTVTTLQGAQNLGSAGLELLWRFGKVKPITFSLNYDGEWGSRYMSHEGMVKFCKDF